jgi:predicted dehydrogenase
MGKVKVAVIGAGDRGKDRYGTYILENQEMIECVAVAEPNELRRKEMANLHNISEEHTFESWEALLNREKLADGVIIATQDDMHYEPTLKALELGYDVLLEKPMSNDLKETFELGEAAKKSKSTFMICHVLRYTPFFSSIKELIEKGTIGQVMSLQHNENIAYYHMAHSFVRGNWRNSKESSPIILAKSCHDMDIISWLVNSSCESISSYGSLSFFRSENQPIGASDRCLECAVEEECDYSAQSLYYKHIGTWPSTTITEDQTSEGITKALKTGPYGRCAFKCDNDVCDHQVTIIEFKNGVTATFNLSAFTKKQNRSIKIMGTKGEIRGLDTENLIEVRLFSEEESYLVEPKLVKGGHNGGDTGIMNDFVSLMKGREGQALTTAEQSVESHMMAFAAEHSRLNRKVIEMKDFFKEMMT